jgi:Ca2+/Na+ antiporter
MITKPGGGLKILGLGALACVGCCAGPILAFVGGLGIAGLVSTTIIGAAGVAIAVIAAFAYVIVRRRRRSACAVTHPDAVSVAIPTRRGPAVAPEEVLTP